MTAEDFDRDVENVGRLPGKSEVQGSTGLILLKVYRLGTGHSALHIESKEARLGLEWSVME
jgi:hypothetical protein